MSESTTSRPVPTTRRSVTAGQRLVGIVSAFDEHVGFGHIRDQANNEWFFHCTQISNGERTIAVDTSVTFTIVAGRLGQWEAIGVSERNPNSPEPLSGPFPKGGARSEGGTTAPSSSPGRNVPFPNDGDSPSASRSRPKSSGPFPEGGRADEDTSTPDRGGAVRAGVFSCPVCTATVEGEPRQYEICDACGWEDDPVQFDEPTYAGGANVESLNAAKLAWAKRHHRDKGH